MLDFFLFLWVIFALLDPDPDPQFECGSMRIRIRIRIRMRIRIRNPARNIVVPRNRCVFLRDKLVY